VVLPNDSALLIQFSNLVQRGRVVEERVATIWFANVSVYDFELILPKYCRFFHKRKIDEYPKK